MTNEQTAQAFSAHRFEATFEHLAPDAVWHLVGAERIDGRVAIVEACRSTAAEISASDTVWLRFLCAGTGDVVAVDAVGRYTGPDGVSTVSSCDIFEFDGETITAITSYAVELPPAP